MFQVPGFSAEKKKIISPQSLYLNTQKGHFNPFECRPAPMSFPLIPPKATMMMMPMESPYTMTPDQTMYQEYVGYAFPCPLPPPYPSRLPPYILGPTPPPQGICCPMNNQLQQPPPSASERNRRTPPGGKNNVQFVLPPPPTHSSSSTISSSSSKKNFIIPKKRKSPPTIPMTDLINNDDSSTDQSYHQGRWTEEEHRLFMCLLKEHGHCWTKISRIIKTRSEPQVRSHAQNRLLRKLRIDQDMAEVAAELAADICQQKDEDSSSSSSSSISDYDKNTSYPAQKKLRVSTEQHRFKNNVQSPRESRIVNIDSQEEEEEEEDPTANPLPPTVKCTASDISAAYSLLSASRRYII